MKKIQLFLLRYICKKLVVQGYQHEKNIINYYKIMRECAKEEFYEDSKSTLDSFLQECFDKSK